MERFDKVAHGMDTQINEPLNNFVAWLASKNKHHNGSCSPERGALMALDLHSVGYLTFFRSTFFRALFKLMKTDTTPGFDHCLCKQFECLFPNSPRIAKIAEVWIERLCDLAVGSTSLEGVTVPTTSIDDEVTTPLMCYATGTCRL